MIENDQIQEERGNFVILSRKLLKSVNDPIGSNAITLGIWSWILLSAAWRPRKERVRGHIIDLQRGELVTSEPKMADALALSRSTLRRHLELLEKNDSIEQVRGQVYTVIKIKKYGTYQDFKTCPRTGLRTGDGQVADRKRTGGLLEPAPDAGEQPPNKLTSKPDNNNPPYTPPEGGARRTVCSHAREAREIAAHIFAPPDDGSNRTRRVNTASLSRAAKTCAADFGIEVLRELERQARDADALGRFVFDAVKFRRVCERVSKGEIVFAREESP